MSHARWQVRRADVYGLPVRVDVIDDRVGDDTALRRRQPPADGNADLRARELVEVAELGQVGRPGGAREHSDLIVASMDLGRLDAAAVHVRLERLPVIDAHGVEPPRRHRIWRRQGNRGWNAGEARV